MKVIFNDFKHLYKDIMTNYDKLKLVRQKYDETEKNISIWHQNQEKEMEKKLNDYELLRKKINAYRDLARSHIISENITISPKPVDLNILARLSVQISSIYNDSYSRNLYYESSCQILFIENEIQRLKCKGELNADADNLHQQNRRKYEENITAIQEDVVSLLSIEKNKQVIKNIRKIEDHFSNKNDNLIKNINFGNQISLGSFEFPMTLELEETQKNKFRFPLMWDFEEEKKVYIEYTNSSEEKLLGGLRQLIYNILKFNKKEFGEIIFIDPVRLDNSVLGKIEPLVYIPNQIISPVPSSSNDIRDKLKLISDYYSNSNESHEKKLIILHNFPSGYSQESLVYINKLCANSMYYDFDIIITNNIEVNNSYKNELVEYIKLKSKMIYFGENQIFVSYSKELEDSMQFDWYQEPKTIIEEVKTVETKEITNVYEEHINIDNAPRYIKGDRTLSHIPYGIDSDGNLLCLDFNHTNFASFICGASRSGKSTLLHTLINGLLKQKHPDDIEIWLIDFKMTEFSRYIENLPPHIRYIILDESPELVYDIIDRLLEIMTKRQNILKGKWDKVLDVPREKYMPSMFIIIDEFSVMSQIIADSITEGKDNYAIKLQTLLAKGAALGLHFIFSSQGFTSGTRGLNDFSKKQVQQRIALKTEYHEIRATLDLQNISDADKSKMEQLKPHYALVKNENPNYHGDYLTLAHVLYNKDKEKTNEFIKKINKTHYPTTKFEYDNEESYIDKRTMIIDGNNYITFDRMLDEKKKIIQNTLEEDEIAIFVGEPKRMLLEYPIKLTKEFQENILIVSSPQERNTMISLTSSIAESLKLQNKRLNIISNKSNKIVSQCKDIVGKENLNVLKSLDDICDYIKKLKEKISNRVESKEVCMLFDIQNIFTEIEFYSKGKLNTSQTTSVTYEKRKKGEDDILTLLAKAQAGLKIEKNNETEKEQVLKTDDKIYDAREDLKYVLMQGSKLGYHFILFNNTYMEFKQTTISSEIFKHSILSRNPRFDISNIVGIGDSKIVAELSNEIFRYSNKLESLNYKPYIYKGLTIGGFLLNESGIVEEEEEEYLL